MSCLPFFFTYSLLIFFGCRTLYMVISFFVLLSKFYKYRIGFCLQISTCQPHLCHLIRNSISQVEVFYFRISSLVTIINLSLFFLIKTSSSLIAELRQFLFSLSLFYEIHQDHLEVEGFINYLQFLLLLFPIFFTSKLN